MKNTLDGGEAVVEAFRKHGVDYILSSPGTEWAPVWEAMANQIEHGRNGPRLMDCWHETLAVDIAAAWPGRRPVPCRRALRVGRHAMGRHGRRRAEALHPAELVRQVPPVGKRLDGPDDHFL